MHVLLWSAYLVAAVGLITWEYRANRDSAVEGKNLQARMQAVRLVGNLEREVGRLYAIAVEPPDLRLDQRSEAGQAHGSIRRLARALNDELTKLEFAGSEVAVMAPLQEI